MNNKTQKTLVTSIAAVFAAATLALFGISGEKIIETEYNITQDGTNAYMEIYAPKEYSFDIVELLCNGQSVTKTVLPNGKLTTIPFVFSNLDNCELRFSKLGEVIAIGNFKDDKLYIAIKSDTNQSTSDEATDDIKDGAENDADEK